MAYLALSVVIFCFLVMIFTRIGPDFVLMGGVTILLLTGVLSPSEALSGFSNEGMITVAMLYIVAKGVSQTGAVAWVVEVFLDDRKIHRVGTITSDAASCWSKLFG